MTLVGDKPRLYENFEDIEIVPYEDIIETKLLEEVLHPLHITSSDDAPDEQIAVSESDTQSSLPEQDAPSENSENGDNAIEE